LYGLIGDYDLAFKDFEKALSINPKCKNALQFRGSLYFDKNDYHKAIKDIKMALRLDPTDKMTLVISDKIKKHLMKENSTKQNHILKLVLIVLSTLIASFIFFRFIVF
jgi:tetratricopeptide (TPR) repeat protein